MVDDENSNDKKSVLLSFPTERVRPPKKSDEELRHEKEIEIYNSLELVVNEIHERADLILQNFRNGVLPDLEDIQALKICESGMKRVKDSLIVYGLRDMDARDKLDDAEQKIIGAYRILPTDFFEVKPETEIQRLKMALDKKLNETMNLVMQFRHHSSDSTDRLVSLLDSSLHAMEDAKDELLNAYNGQDTFIKKDMIIFETTKTLAESMLNEHKPDM